MGAVCVVGVWRSARVAVGEAVCELLRELECGLERGLSARSVRTAAGTPAGRA